MSWNIIDRYQLGYVATPLSVRDAQFSGMLSIPYLTGDTVKALKFRRMMGDGPKYAQYEGQKPRLYNSGAYFAASNQIGLAEGEPDTIASTEYLRVPTMGCPGAEMWQEYSKVWAPLFKDFSHVWVFVQGDHINEKTGLRPGAEHAKRVAHTLGWRAQLIWCPEGQDVASMVAGGRASDLISQMEVSE